MKSNLLCNCNVATGGTSLKPKTAALFIAKEERNEVVC
jgi:hypothetical protein